MKARSSQANRIPPSIARFENPVSSLVTAFGEKQEALEVSEPVVDDANDFARVLFKLRPYWPRLRGGGHRSAGRPMAARVKYFGVTSKSVYTLADERKVALEDRMPSAGRCEVSNRQRRMA